MVLRKLRTCAVLCSLLACAASKTLEDGGTDTAMPDSVDSATLPDVPQLDVAPPPVRSLALDAVVPGHGPAQGGRLATLRGSGFAESGFTVTFGGVEASGAMFIDSHRIEVLVPAGTAGPVDVSLSQLDETATLVDGYTYDALRVTPPMGSFAGGTLVTIETTGTAFASGDTVSFGGSDCTDVTIASSTELSCRAPAGTVGTVDVTVIHLAGDATAAPDAYRYVDPFVMSGGLSGESIEGAIDVTVLHGRMPVADAFVILGEDLGTSLKGRTDAAGRITLSADGLVGPANIHIAKTCYETTSFVGFDAARVTVFLTRQLRPACMMPPPVLPPPVPSSGSAVSGELVWPGSGTGPQPWSNVPDPLPGEVRVAYVYTTRECPTCTTPDPGLGGVSRVLETAPGVRGYPYDIYSRSSGLAVYAVAGTENESTGQFTPFAMGIARAIVLARGERRTGVDIAMDIPLDRFVDVEVTGLPAVTSAGPDQLSVTSQFAIGEGWFAPDDDRSTMVSSTATSFRFGPAPPLTGLLGDAWYDIDVSWSTGVSRVPFTQRRILRVAPSSGTVVVDDFLGIPVATAPVLDEPMPADRVMRWSADGPAGDTIMVTVFTEHEIAWRAFVRGDLLAAPFPDLSREVGVDDIAPGSFMWFVWSTRSPGVVFDEFSYNSFQNVSHIARSLTSTGRR